MSGIKQGFGPAADLAMAVAGMSATANGQYRVDRVELRSDVMRALEHDLKRVLGVSQHGERDPNVPMHLAGVPMVEVDRSDAPPFAVVLDLLYRTEHMQGPFQP